MAEHQGPRRHAEYMVIVDGRDISSKLDPYLISIQVVDSFQRGHDTANIELDDSYGVLQIPPDGVTLQVLLGWANTGPRPINEGRYSEGFTSITTLESQKTALQYGAQEMPFGGPGMAEVFNGVVSNVESGFGRKGGGRRLWIEATSGDVKGQVKSLQKHHWGEGSKDDSSGGQGGGGGGAGGAGGAGGGGGGQMIPLKTVLTDMFSKAGLNVQMAPGLENIAREYWHVNDSPMNFAQRMARSNGMLFKIANGTAMMIPAKGGVNSMGKKLAEIDAVWGVNLIGWRIKPYAGRPQFGETAARIFNIHNAAHETIKSAIGGDTPFGGSDAVMHNIAQVATKGEAEQGNKGGAEDSKSKRGKGWILLNGEPLCYGGCQIAITGARPGVDGTYLCTEAEHNYTRGGGYTTRANVQYPEPIVTGYKWKTKPKKKKPPPVEKQSTDPTKPGYVEPPAPTGNPMGDYDPTVDLHTGQEVKPQSTHPGAPGYVKAQSTDPNAPGYYDPNKKFGLFEPGGFFNPFR
jgi:phage protein D